MRRLLILIIALAMVIVAPATATAIDNHEEFTLTAEFNFVGFAEDGVQIFEGYHYLYTLDGVLVDEGPVSAMVYVGGGNLHYSAVTVYEGTEATVVAKQQGQLIAFEATEDGSIATYSHKEIVVDGPGFAGKGQGLLVVTNGPEGVQGISNLFYVIRPGR